MKQIEVNEIVAKHKLWLEFKKGIRADFSNENLRGIDFNGMNLRNAIFTGADLRGAKFNGANLIDVDFTYANLRNVDFTYADLRGAKFNGANLCNANLRGASLIGAKFNGANLNDAIFTDANLLGANFHNTDFRGTNLLILKLPPWDVYIHAETIQIEDQHHSHDKWLNFNDREIKKIDTYMLEWWKEYKSLIVAGIEIVKAQVARKLESTVSYEKEEIK
jgi:hypothetical protein